MGLASKSVIGRRYSRFPATNAMRAPSRRDGENVTAGICEVRPSGKRDSESCHDQRRVGVEIPRAAGSQRADEQRRKRDGHRALPQRRARQRNHGAGAGAAGSVNASCNRNRTVADFRRCAPAIASRDSVSAACECRAARRRGSAFQSGSARSTAASVSETSSPSNTRLPVSISKNTQPNAHTSERRSATRPLACSGAMYAAVPSTTPTCVAANVSVGELRRSTPDRSR